MKCIFALALLTVSTNSFATEDRIHRLDGKLNHQLGFKFAADSYYGLERQCYDFYVKNVDFPVKVIELSYNDSHPYVAVNMDSYWRSVYEVCRKILSPLSPD